MARVIVSLVLLSALGADRSLLEARDQPAHPSSLAQVWKSRSQNPMPGYVSEMEQWAKMSSSNAKKNKAAIRNQQKDMERLVKDAMDGPQRSVSYVSRFVDKQLRELATAKAKVMEKSQRYSAEAQGIRADIETTTEMDANAATDLKEQIEAGTEELVQEMEQKSEEHVSSWAEDMEGLNAYLAETKDDKAEGIADLKSVNTEEVDEIQSKVKDQTKTESERYKESASVVKQIAAMGKGIKKTMGNVNDMVQKDVVKVQTAANNFPSQLVSTISNANSLMQKVGQKVESTVNKNLKAAKKDIDKEVDGIRKAMKTKADELKGSISGMETDILSSKTTAQKEIQAELQHVLLEQESMTGELETTATDGQDLLSKAEKQPEELQVEIEKAVRDLQIKLKADQNGFMNSKAALARRVRDRAGEARDTVMDDLQKKQAIIKQRVSTTISDVDAGLKAGTEQFEGTDAVLGEEIRSLVDRISQARTKERTLGQSLQQEMSTLDDSGKDAEVAINQMKEHSMAQIGSINDHVTGEIEEADRSVISQTGKLRQNTIEQLDKMNQDMKGHINKFGEELTSKLKKGDAEVSYGSRQTNSLLDALGRTVGDIVKENTLASDEIPRAGEFIEENRAGIEANAKELEASLEDGRKKVLTDVDATMEAINGDSQKRLDTTAAGLQTSTGDNTKRVDTVLGTLESSVTGLESSSEKETKDTLTMLAKLMGQTGKTNTESGDLNTEIEHYGSQLDQAISEGAMNIKSVQNAARRDVNAEGVQLTNLVNGRMASAQTRISGDMTVLGKKLNTGIDDFEAKSTGEIQGDADKLDGFMGKSMTELEGISHLTYALQTAIEKQTASVERRDETYEAQMANIGKQQQAIEDRTKKDLDEEKHALGARSDQMSEMAYQRMHDMESERNVKANDLSSQTDQMFSEEKNRQERAQSNMDQKFGTWEKGVEGDIAAVDKNTVASEAAKKGYENTLRGAQSKYASEVGNLNSEIEIGEQRIQGEIQGEESRVGKLMTGELGGMEGLLGKLQSTQNGANGEVDHMKEQFGDKLGMYKGQAAAASDAMEYKLKQLEEGEVDLAGEFSTNTEGVRKKVKTLQEKVKGDLEEAGQTTEELKKQMADVRAGREKRAVGIHQKATDMKGAALSSIGDAIMEVEGMTSKSDNLLNGMKSEQKDYDMKLNKMIGFSADQDPALIDAMNAGANKLESSRKGLTDWQRMFKHRTAAWRNEVERRIRQISNSLEDEQSGIESAQLDQELKTSAGLRDMQRAVEDNVAKAAGKEAGEMNSLVGDMQGKMNHLMNAAGGDEASEANEMNAMHDQMDANGASQDKDVNEIEAEGTNLKEKSANFNTAVETAKGKIHSQMLLPSLENSEKSLRTQQDMDQLQSKLNGLQSLLQMGGNVDSVQALRSLNSEMANENAQLKSEDDKLDSQAGHITEMLRAKGISV